MLFVQPEDVVFRLKLYEIGCMMRNFNPNVHGEVQICHLDTMQRGTDGFVRIGKKFYSQMSVAYAFNQTYRRRRVWRQSGQAERLRHTVQRVQKGGGSLKFWGGIMWDRRTPLVVMEGAETAIR